MFQKATKTDARLRLGLIAPSGAGKTYTGLKVGTLLCRPGKRLAVVDSEHGSASKYADIFDFDRVELSSFHPERYIEAIKAAEAAGIYDAILLDSISHAWMGKDGALELKDNAERRGRGNSFTAWRDVTPLHNRLIDSMIQSQLHVIATMRAKTEYVVEQEGGKKSTVRKVGIGAVQRDGMEYEFDITADLDLDHNLYVSKTRCPAIDGRTFSKPGEEFVGIVRTWLSGVAPAPAPAAAPAPTPAPAPAAAAPPQGEPLSPGVDPPAMTEMDQFKASGFTDLDEWRAVNRVIALFDQVKTLDALHQLAQREIMPLVQRWPAHRDALRQSFELRAKEIQ